MQEQVRYCSDMGQNMYLANIYAFKQKLNRDAITHPNAFFVLILYLQTINQYFMYSYKYINLKKKGVCVHYQDLQ